MELDDLKKIVESSTHNYNPVNNNIMELISHKSQEPLSRLAQKMKFGLLPFPVTVLLFLAVFVTNSRAFHSFLMWMLLGILFIEFINVLFNYGLVKKLQNPLGSTKENFISKMNRLRKSFQIQFLITLCLYSLMAIVLETMMYNHADSNFNTWFETPLLLRIICYIVFLIIQFILKRYFYKKQFGQHIEELNSLIQQFK